MTSLQVCGTAWVAHVICRRQLLDVLASASWNGRPNPVANADGRGGTPNHDAFHGMVARRGEAARSSRRGALLIDDLDLRFAVVRSELFRRNLRSAVAALDPLPLARHLSHFARWYAAAERSPRVDAVAQAVLDAGVRGLGLEAA